LKKSLSTLGLKVYYQYCWLKCRLRGLKFVPPNYAFYEKHLNSGISIDVGVGDDPDFTTALINNYDIKAFIVDPTKRHADKLEKFSETHPSTHFLKYALGSKSEEKQFFESESNVSGSLRGDHKNVLNDPLVTYNVQVITLDKLLEECGNKSVAIMKIDIEGEEYDLIKSLKKEDLTQIKQLIVEFHHNTVRSYTIKDTLAAVKVLENFGMKAIIYNGTDCLFYWAK
jgi:FkbM family methyltransferase